MLSPDTLRAVERIIGFEAMTRVVRMETVLHTTKPIISIEQPSAFSDKCIRKFSRLLGEDEGSARQAMARLFACVEYEDRVSLEGLGGCVVIPIETLIAQADAQLTDPSEAETTKRSPRKKM